MLLVDRSVRIKHKIVFPAVIFILLLSGCQAIDKKSCSITEPVWATPPDDSAVEGQPQAGYYFVNEDRSIWATAWWAEKEDFFLTASDDEIKVGWFRPAGIPLEISGERIDAQASPLDANIPCCYPTRFQATGFYFPTGGCWEVTAIAADRALSFVIWVEP